MAADADETCPGCDPGHFIWIIGNPLTPTLIFLWISRSGPPCPSLRNSSHTQTRHLAHLKCLPLRQSLTTLRNHCLTRKFRISNDSPSRQSSPRFRPMAGAEAPCDGTGDGCGTRLVRCAQHRCAAIRVRCGILRGIGNGFGRGSRELPWIPARLLALTLNSGMRYRMVFRLSCGCPPDGTLSPWIASASRAGICKRFG